MDTLAKDVPKCFLCPISKELMADPVVAADGHSYEKASLQWWLKSHGTTSPVTNEALGATYLTNFALKSAIKRHVQGCGKLKIQLQRLSDKLRKAFFNIEEGPPREAVNEVSAVLLELASQGSAVVVENSAGRSRHSTPRQLSASSTRTMRSTAGWSTRRCGSSRPNTTCSEALSDCLLPDLSAPAPYSAGSAGGSSRGGSMSPRKARPASVTSMASTIAPPLEFRRHSSGGGSGNHSVSGAGARKVVDGGDPIGCSAGRADGALRQERGACSSSFRSSRPESRCSDTVKFNNNEVRFMDTARPESTCSEVRFITGARPESTCSEVRFSDHERPASRCSEDNRVADGGLAVDSALDVYSPPLGPSSSDGFEGSDLDFSWVDFDSVECSATWNGHSGDVCALVPLPDGRLASGSRGGSVLLQKPSAMGSASTMLRQGHESFDQVFSLAVVGHGGVLACGMAGGAVELWRLSDGERFASLEGAGYAVYAVAAVDEDRLAVASTDGAVVLWSVSRRAQLGNLYGHTDEVRSLAPFGPGRLVSGSMDTVVRIWNTDYCQCEVALHGHERGIWSVAALGDSEGRLATGAEDKTVRIWHVATGRCEATLQGHSSWICCVVPLCGARFLASASADNSIWIWDLASGSCLATLSGHKDAVRCLAVLPDGQLASGSDDKSVKLWRPVTAA